MVGGVGLMVGWSPLLHSDERQPAIRIRNMATMPEKSSKENNTVNKIVSLCNKFILIL